MVILRETAEEMIRKVANKANYFTVESFALSVARKKYPKVGKFNSIFLSHDPSYYLISDSFSNLKITPAPGGAHFKSDFGLFLDLIYGGTFLLIALWIRGMIYQSTQSGITVYVRAHSYSICQMHDAFDICCTLNDTFRLSY